MNDNKENNDEVFDLFTKAYYSNGNCPMNLENATTGKTISIFLKNGNTILENNYVRGDVAYIPNFIDSELQEKIADIIVNSLNRYFFSELNIETNHKLYLSTREGE